MIKFFILIISFIFILVSDSFTADVESFLIVGKKFSEVKKDFSDNYVTTESAGGRITHSFLGKYNNLTRFAVKNDIIEVVEVFNVFEDENDALNLFETLAMYLTIDEKCKLVRGYNSTLEFSKKDMFIRIEAIPSNYGHLIKFTVYK